MADYESRLCGTAGKPAVVIGLAVGQASPASRRLGRFRRTPSLKSIGSESVSIDVTGQSTENITGSITLMASEQIANFKATINKNGVVHITARAARFAEKITGTHVGDSLAGKLSTPSGRTKT